MNFKMFASEEEKQIFFKDLYIDGLNCARKRYRSSSSIDCEQSWGNYTEIVHNAFVYIGNIVETKEFQSKLHIRAWFFLNLRAQASKLYKERSRNRSLNQKVYEDSEYTLEDFIPTNYGEDEDETINPELKQKIKAAMQTLNSDQKYFIQKVWLEGATIESIAPKRKSASYVQRSLDAAKLKLQRNIR
jgi:DNA-directed RNA polymerase specialized sigma24 family protein